MDDYDPMNDVKNLREMLAAALANLNTERQRAQAERGNRDRELRREAVNDTLTALHAARETFAEMYAGKRLSVPGLLIFGDAVAAIRGVECRLINGFLSETEKHTQTEKNIDTEHELG
jgi:hypothetical protein